MYGKPSDRGMYGVGDLLRDPECPPCIFKRDFHDWIKLLNQLRISLKKRFNEFGLDLKEFQNHCLHYDKVKTKIKSRIVSIISISSRKRQDGYLYNYFITFVDAIMFHISMNVWNHFLNL